MPESPEVYESQTEEPQMVPNWFTVAVLAVANTPQLILPGGEAANPSEPLLYSFSLCSPNIHLPPEELNKVLIGFAGMQVQQQLPRGYIVSLVKVAPIPADQALQAAAAVIGAPVLDDYNGLPGASFFHEPSGEAAINTFRPGVDTNNRSPRYSLLCPYCGRVALRFTGKIDAREPDGYRFKLSTEGDGPAHGPDLDEASDWNGHCGVRLEMTCEGNHRFGLRFVEDVTPQPDGSVSGPTVFLVFDYLESPRAWSAPIEPGSGYYPSRKPSRTVDLP